MPLSRRRKKRPELSWHPDFRDREKLPDIKPVRTRFFISTFITFLAATLLLLFLYREYEVLVLQNQIEGWRVKIGEMQEEDREIVAMNRAFVSKTRKFDKVAAFMERPLPATEFLKLLGSHLPEEMVMSEMRFQRMRVTLRGTIAAGSQEASDLVNVYLETLQEEALVQNHFDDIWLDFLVRDPRTMQLTYQIYLDIPEPEDEEDEE